MKKDLRIFLPTALLVCLSSCAELNQIMPQKPSVTHAKFEIEPPKADLRTALRILKTAETGELESRLTLTLQNPNNFEVNLESIGYRIFLKDLKALEGKTAGGFHIAAAGPSEIPIDLVIPFKNIPDLIQTLAKGPESITFKVEGEVGLAGLLSGITVPYSYTGNVGKKPKP